MIAVLTNGKKPPNIYNVLLTLTKRGRTVKRIVYNIKWSTLLTFQTFNAITKRTARIAVHNSLSPFKPSLFTE
ncbi:hypothetical protein Trydic_g11623 [Trypoxylus dichotomus]